MMIDKLQASTRNESGTYDQEWVQLVIEAKQAGFTIAEIRSFLQKGESYTSMNSSFQKPNLQHI